METQKTLNSQILKRKNGTEGIRLQTSDPTTKLQSSKEYGTGTKKQKNKNKNRNINQ